MSLKFRACRFLSSALAAAGLSALSACAQQPPQPQAPVYTGPTYPRLSAFVQAIGIGPPVKSWGFNIRIAKGQCVSAATWDWPNMRIVSAFGKTVKDYCAADVDLPERKSPGKTIVGLEFRVSEEPLIVRWVDAQGRPHVASFDVHKLIGERALYGGGVLTLEFAGPRVNLYLDEPDFANKKPGWLPPLVRHVLATSE